MWYVVLVELKSHPFNSKINFGTKFYTFGGTGV